ncbi:unnamed protein product [Caenorhabditis nigoni]
MSNSFGIITRNQAVCNTIICSIFFLFIIPMQMKLSDDLISHSDYIGIWATSIYDISNLSHVFIAINRFCAVFLPLHYDKLFTVTRTKRIRNIIWIFSFAKCIIIYKVFYCYNMYYPEAWTLAYIDTPECITCTWYTDFVFNTTLVVFTILVNLLTACKAGQTTKRILRSTAVFTISKQKQREINFIKQTFFQGTSIFAGQVSYYVIAPFVENLILIFVLSACWAFMHAVEGGIILASNQEIRRMLSWKKKKPSTIFISSGT